MERKKLILSGVGGFFAVMSSYFAYDHFAYVNTDNAQIEGHAVMLAPKVSGFVADVKVVEGQKVKQGDVLVELDDRDFQNALKQIRGDLTSIEARKRDSERNFKRLTELYSKGTVSQQQFDTVSTSYSESKAKFDAISAQVAQAELNLENTKIKAPVDGFIAKKSVERGQLAAAGTPLIGFIGSQERWVTANFKETELADIKIGSRAEIEVDALPGRSFHGSVSSVSAATGATFALLPPDNATGNFTKVVQRVPVKIQIENLGEPDIDALKAGLSAMVKIHRH